MDRKAFHQLLKKYVDGTCPDEEKHLVDHWYELLDEEGHLPVTDAEIDNIEQRLWDKIKQCTTENDQPGKVVGKEKKIRNAWIKWTAAAALSGVIITSTLLYHPAIIHEVSVIDNRVKEGWQEEINDTKKIKDIKLEDGSIVSLQPQARLAFPKQFANDKREVFFEGEGFFKVTKNALRPFFVYNGHLITQVLGTSFTIKISKEQIEVSVRTGKVAVYENSGEVKLTEVQKKSNGVIITPNQKVTYNTENRNFVTSLVETPVAVPAENDKPVAAKFVFDDTPLSEVLRSLEKTYNIQIIVENENLNHCPFTGDITGQSLYNKLELICQSIQATYEIKGTNILIKGKGCN